MLREVLDADQVRRIAAGQPLEEHRPAAAASPVPDEGTKRPSKDRGSLVPPIAPLNKPVTQE